MRSLEYIRTECSPRICGRPSCRTGRLVEAWRRAWAPAHCPTLWRQNPGRTVQPGAGHAQRQVSPAWRQEYRSAHRRGVRAVPPGALERMLKVSYTGAEGTMLWYRCRGPPENMRATRCTALLSPPGGPRTCFQRVQTGLPRMQRRDPRGSGGT